MWLVGGAAVTIAALMTIAACASLTDPTTHINLGAVILTILSLLLGAAA
jgi:hypothetical protein